MAPNWPNDHQCRQGGARNFWNKRDQHKAPITILSGRGKKTTSAMALMDWSVWRHCISSKYPTFLDKKGRVLLIFYGSETLKGRVLCGFPS